MDGCLQPDLEEGEPKVMFVSRFGLWFYCCEGRELSLKPIF